MNEQLKELFPLENYQDLEIIAEPGRYFVTSAYTLVTNVIEKRTSKSKSGKVLKLLNVLNIFSLINFIL